jgi:hypothetical protein
MNKFFEFRVDFDLISELLLLLHPKCGWVLHLSSDEVGTVALDTLMKHAQDHVCQEGEQ